MNATEMYFSLRHTLDVAMLWIGGITLVACAAFIAWDLWKNRKH